ncbi:hypothetical protein CPAST_c26710 [Clostridium pasteurianum DSM 525 = ATCC 6013]|uniref:VCBS repeat-containing protein n=1 Tax=Clostridium pasteurianum DSM 525 = ATCC 6013 TaxID=1262449 RepID=A0A0H3J9H0_CLOPA|nr:hypothetical protein [Clostridium pasteurianum]AJA48738.1 hypothetical protein CPAST_c26710 [Clostridium pasteurianum DSM 525 = ATCC 6013]AJA52726.1 hypothetical protein CLPA_c26710 [Clostridium pasteurianum DSM 525 = ATCC 6013]AOZ75961.1 hypothetical protein AQ983_12980 [Clostridium pasteurianum DSM 525 = ATCC 6013]AOZ79757.1 hypothetical protein AQ984_12975 [Clostridium pasteurianum]ELP60037.1 hypothetical protein F502_05357 [Clostridium pasteurianum DSM 525 = ATCC 6013]
MKLKVFFFKKQYIYYSVLTILLIILSILFFISKDSLPTISTINTNKTIKNHDITGDGIKDLISIKWTDKGYNIDVISNGKNYPLTPNKKLDTLGNHYDYWPLRVTFLDISRDKIPEVFIQASENGKSIQHTFIWNNNKFKDLLCNANNLIGFIDLHNNRTPKIISGNIYKNTITMSNYIFSQGKLINYFNDYNDNFLGKDSILSFINYIQSLPENQSEKPLDIFLPDTDAAYINAINTLSASDNTFTFQDGIFMDNRCNKDGDITETKWTLNFKAISNKDKNVVKNYTLDLLLKSQGDPSDKNYFKILSIQILSQK